MAEVIPSLVHCVIGYSDSTAYLAAVYLNSADAEKERKRLASERQWQDFSWSVIVRALQ